MQSKHRAFTLVEILIAVFVLAVIAAILFPLFARSRESHHNPRGQCLNNLKQLALAFKQYQSDFDERYPLVFVTSGSSTGVPPYGWADALQPYIKNTQVYQCPSDTNEGNDDPTKPNYCDYWYNANFVHKVSRGTKFIITGASESLLGPNSQTVIAGEGGNTNRTPTGDARYNQCGDGTALTSGKQICPVSPIGLATFPAAQLHTEKKTFGAKSGANFAFADGHVKWYRGNSPTSSFDLLNNGMAQSTISQTPYQGKATFSLLNLP